jgi:hypothetical protein
MANYMNLTPTSEKYIASLAKFDESQLNIEALRSRPDVGLPKVIDRPNVDIEKMSVIASTGMVNVHIIRPSNSHMKTLPGMVYM